MTPSTTRPGERLSTGPEATQRLAAALAGIAEAGDVLCLWGELGAGKTQFAKGFGRGLGVTATINSPTFVLMTEHVGRLPLFHLDLYRLADAADAWAGGLLDERQGEGIVLIEWPDRLGEALPLPRLDVVIEATGEDERRIRIEAVGAGLDRYLEAAATADLAGIVARP